MISRIKQLAKNSKNHPGFYRYFTNTSWLLAEQAIRMVAGLLVGIWVARYLGPVQFGLLSYALAFAAIFSSIAKLGLDSILVRNLVQEPEHRDAYMGTAFWLKLVSALAMLGIIYLITQLTNNNDTIKLYILIIASGFIFQSFEVVDFYFQSKVLSKFVSLCKLTQLIISSALKIIYIILNKDLIWFVWISLFDQITLAVSLYVAYRFQKLENFFFKFNLKLARTLMLECWPLILAGLTVTLYMRVDVIMLQHLAGETEVGIYAAATRISEIGYFLPSIIVASVAPAITNAHAHNSVLYLSRLKQLYFLMIWLAIGISLPISLYSNIIVITLFGSDFSAAAPVISIHLWACIAVFLGVASSQYLLIEQLQKISLYRTLIGLISNVILNFMLIPSMGARGAAIATVISYFMATFSIVFFKKTRGHTVYLLLAPFSRK